MPTAMAVGREIGLYKKGDLVLTGDLEKMTFRKLAQMVDKVSIYARVNPEHKVKTTGSSQQGRHCFHDGRRSERRPR